MKLNYFLVAGAVLVLGGSIVELIRGNTALALVYFNYGVANAVLATL